LAQAALRITPPAALAAGIEQSGKMAQKTKRTDCMINTFKRKIALRIKASGGDSAADREVENLKINI
jgi:hypothetical protein